MSGASTFDDAENEDEALLMDENYSTASKNDSILFLIDASPAMRFLPGSLATTGVSDSTPLSCALQCASITMQNKIMSADKEKLGIMFFNTKNKANSNDFENVFVLHPLAIPDPKKILELEKLDKGNRLIFFSNYFKLCRF